MTMDLTNTQLPIYKMSVFGGGSIANVCGSLLIDGKKDTSFLVDAVNKLFELNDGLRVKINVEGGIPKQRIHPYKKRKIEVIHFADCEELRSYADLYAKQPLSLADNLCEIKIAILPDKFGIIPKLHHLIGDAWAIILIASQFNSLVAGETPETFSFIDYVKQDNSYITSKRYSKDADFFENKLVNYKDPIYVSDCGESSFETKRKTFTMEYNAEKITGFANEKEVSVFSLFFSLFAIYFAHVKKDAEKFCIGTSVLNRSGQQEKNTIASYVNTIPVFVELQNTLSFHENIQNVQSSVLTAMRHQKYNYQIALENLKKNGVSIEKPYDIVINYQNAKIEGDFFDSTWHHNGMQIESLQIQIEDRNNEGSFNIHYDYQVDKFTENDIEYIHSHICNLLDDVIQNPDKIMSELSMLSAENRHKLLYDFNATEYSYDVSDDATIFSLFEKTAKENTDKICIKTAEKDMTFDELLAASEVLDRELRKITNGRKSVIAVIAERSVEMYSAIYGIIRGGNAYLPIDPDYPQERIDYILENSGAVAVASQGKFAHKAKNVPCINMTELLNISADDFTEVPLCDAKPDDTAYVIYTSGSTGNPKGAKISNRSAVNRILWMHDKYPLGSEDVILQKTPYTFDVSVWEHFWWGMCGGSLAVSKPGEHFIPAKILEETNRNKVTHIHFVPSVFELFLNYLESHRDEINKFDSVRYVFLSGEALTANLVQKFYKLFDYGKVTLHNLYGPTECAIDVTYYDCKPTDIDPIPIGKPVYNTQIYIVDKFMNIVPFGLTGELCIAGVNVGQGYLSNPELSAEKFIVNPFGEGRLYRTGDLACWREDGNIIFCGRKDAQIKLGGQRIEIGEIESVIGSFDKVESVAVIVKKTTAADVLVAYYTGQSNCEKTIRDFCSSKLPKYMVPSVIVYLDKLPLNNSGKLDRKALVKKEIDFVRPVCNEPAKNEDERFVCEAFRTVLGDENIGRNTDFFEIGGTSISMISLLSEKGFENITAAEFMRNSTPAGIARIIKKNDTRHREYIEPLYLSEKAEKILIVLPFAGGGAESFSSFINSFKSKNNNMSVYFVRYLHSLEECRLAAEEIACAFENTDIFVYSHCVGSAVALHIIRALESMDICVRHFIAGASIPMVSPFGKNIWRNVPDKLLVGILSHEGAKINSLAPEDITEMLHRFRLDTDFASLSFGECSQKIKTPVSIIISKSDIFTFNYRRAEKIWKKYTETLGQIYFIDSESHYFQSDDSEKLIEILQEII